MQSNLIYEGLCNEIQSDDYDFQTVTVSVVTEEFQDKANQKSIIYYLWP